MLFCNGGAFSGDTEKKLKHAFRAANELNGLGMKIGAHSVIFARDGTNLTVDAGTKADLLAIARSLRGSGIVKRGAAHIESDAVYNGAEMTRRMIIPAEKVDLSRLQQTPPIPST